MTKDIHGDCLTNYDKTHYDKKDNRVIVMCSLRGDFEQTLKNHLLDKV